MEWSCNGKMAVMEKEIKPVMHLLAGGEEVNGGGPAFDKPNKKQIIKIKYKQQKYEIIKIIIVIEIINK